MKLSTRVVRGRVVTLPAGTKLRKRPSGWIFEPTRRRILKRDGYLCQVRLPGCTDRADVVDHIDLVADGGGDEDSNLRAACAHCNGKRGRRHA